MESVAGPAWLECEDSGIMFKIQISCGRRRQQLEVMLCCADFLL